MTQNNEYWLNKFKKIAVPKIIEKFHPEKILLFGSRANNTANKESDIDVVVVSSHFKNLNFTERMPAILKLIKFPKHVDLICYTPEEFENLRNKSSLLIEALEYGIELPL